jgi:hypothetical protein
MGWARLDDGFDDHPKVMALLECEQGAAAIGLWTLCLTWAHRNTRKRGKTPGDIPAYLPRRYLGPGAAELAQLLVKEELWEKYDEGGWHIHDFDGYLPSEAMSRSRAEAGRKGGLKRAQNASIEASQDIQATSLVSGDRMNTNPTGQVGRTQASSLNGEATSLEVQARPKQRSSMAVGKGSSTADLNPQLPIQLAASQLAAAPTITQRSKRITDAYAEAEPMCKWPAVNAVVIRAIKAGKWADDEIQAALLRMAGENRSVTVDALRTELNGLPAWRHRSTTDDRVREGFALAEKYRQKELEQ